MKLVVAELFFFHCGMEGGGTHRRRGCRPASRCRWWSRCGATGPAVRSRARTRSWPPCRAESAPASGSPWRATASPDNRNPTLPQQQQQQQQQQHHHHHYLHQQRHQRHTEKNRPDIDENAKLESRDDSIRTLVVLLIFFEVI